MKELTFGEKAVGLTFNPGGNVDVQEVKQEFATVIDTLNDLRVKEAAKPNNERSAEKLRMYSVAITEAQTAQMWAVKAVTWQY